MAKVKATTDFKHLISVKFNPYLPLLVYIKPKMKMNRRILQTIKNIEYHPELQSYSMHCYFQDLDEPKYWMMPANFFDPISTFMSDLDEVKGENSQSNFVVELGRTNEDETVENKKILDFDKLCEEEEFRKKQEKKNIELLKTTRISKASQ